MNDTNENSTSTSKTNKSFDWEVFTILATVFCLSGGLGVWVINIQSPLYGIGSITAFLLFGVLGTFSSLMLRSTKATQVVRHREEIPVNEAPALEAPVNPVEHSLERNYHVATKQNSKFPYLFLVLEIIASAVALFLGVWLGEFFDVPPFIALIGLIGLLCAYVFLVIYRGRLAKN